MFRNLLGPSSKAEEEPGPLMSSRMSLTSTSRPRRPVIAHPRPLPECGPRSEGLFLTIPGTWKCSLTWAALCLTKEGESTSTSNSPLPRSGARKEHALRPESSGARPCLWDPLAPRGEGAALRGALGFRDMQRPLGGNQSTFKGVARTGALNQDRRQNKGGFAQ